MLASNIYRYPTASLPKLDSTYKMLPIKLTKSSPDNPNIPPSRKQNEKRKERKKSTSSTQTDQAPGKPDLEGMLPDRIGPEGI